MKLLFNKLFKSDDTYKIVYKFMTTLSDGKI